MFEASCHRIAKIMQKVILPRQVHGKLVFLPAKDDTDAWAAMNDSHWMVLLSLPNDQTEKERPVA